MVMSRPSAQFCRRVLVVLVYSLSHSSCSTFPTMLLGNCSLCRDPEKLNLPSSSYRHDADSAVGMFYVSTGFIQYCSRFRAEEQTLKCLRIHVHTFSYVSTLNPCVIVDRPSSHLLILNYSVMRIVSSLCCDAVCLCRNTLEPVWCWWQL